MIMRPYSFFYAAASVAVLGYIAYTQLPSADGMPDNWKGYPPACSAEENANPYKVERPCLPNMDHSQDTPRDWSWLW